MADFLSEPWFEVLGQRLADLELDPPAPEGGWVLAVTVADGPRTEPLACWSIHLSGTTVHLDRSPGPPEDTAAPVVHLTVDRATAASIATGELRALRAVMSGALRITGDVRLLIPDAAVRAGAGAADRVAGA